MLITNIHRYVDFIIDLMLDKHSYSFLVNIHGNKFFAARPKKYCEELRVDRSGKNVF